MKEYIFPDFPLDLKIKSKTHYNRYIKFIKSRKNIIDKTVKHHKVPKAYNGSDLSENIIKLTYREHYIAHMILCKTFGDEMTTAFWLMSHYSRYSERLTLNQYSVLRESANKRHSEVMRGRKQSKETIAKRIESRKGYKHSEATKQKISKGNNGKKRTTEQNKENRKRNLNKKVSVETKYKQSIALKNRVVVNNKKIQTLIFLEELDEYKKKGFSEGKIHSSPTKGKIVIHKDSKNKYIKKEDLEKFILLGWEKGQKNKRRIE